MPPKVRHRHKQKLSPASAIDNDLQNAPSRSNLLGSAASSLCLLASKSVEAGVTPSSSSSSPNYGARSHVLHHHHSFSHSPYFSFASSGHGTSELYSTKGATLSDNIRRISLNILNTSSNVLETMRGGQESVSPSSSSSFSSLDPSKYHRHHHLGEGTTFSSASKTNISSSVPSYSNYLANIFTTKGNPLARWSSTSSSSSSSPSSSSSSVSIPLPSSSFASASSSLAGSSISLDDYEDDYYGSGASGSTSTAALIGTSGEVSRLSTTLAAAAGESRASSSPSTESSKMLLMRLMRHVLPSNNGNLIASSSDHELLSDSMIHQPSSSSSVVLSGPSSSTTSAMATLLNSTLTGAANNALTSSDLNVDYGNSIDTNVVASLATSFVNGTSSLAETTAATLSDLSSNLYATYSEYQPTSGLSESSTDGSFGDGPLDWIDIVIIVFKVLILGTIIFSAIFGNMLVIISVFRHHRLRITTNYYIVSLALADILVAIFAMTFNASVVIAGRWVFNTIVCDFWNSCDVLFSTASIMHLSCISYDRYYAIIKPLDYPMKITGKRVAIMITCVWILSALISYIPIFTGLYTTQAAIEARQYQTDVCEWKVNIPYALISSTVSFWMPCGFMLTAYYKIYREAIKQEKFIYRTQQMPAALPNHHHHKQHHNNNNKNGSGATSTAASGGGRNPNAPRHSTASETNNVIQVQAAPHRNSHAEDPESGSSTPTKRTISKMKREHKAAKTLGIIMGAFILCWLPFFIWYVASTICGDACDTPKLVVDLLFWVGYLNSAMNPIIYAYFNREFREAFKETLRNIFCCCFHFQCLEAQRSEAANFNCAYRSQTDVGMVETKYVKD